jgi:hypothetical protein
MCVLLFRWWEGVHRRVRMIARGSEGVWMRGVMKRERKDEQVRLLATPNALAKPQIVFRAHSAT